MAPRFNEPEILQIIKSIEKDEHYVEQFGTDLDEATKQLLGIRSWIRWHPILINVNKLLYYLLTTANGNQTLGEEYCHLIQIGNNQSIPSGIRRFILALLNGLKQSTLGEKFITLIRNRCGVQYQLSNVYSIGDLQRDLVHLFSLLNLTIFFLNGTFPDLLKRILSIRYLSLVRREGPIGVDRTSSRLLSSLSMVQLALWLYTRYNIVRYDALAESLSSSSSSTTTSNESSESSNTNDGIKCLLCLSTRTNATLIECGHIFCWNCLAKWFQYKDQCPTCRRPARPNRLVFLHNYS